MPGIALNIAVIRCATAAGPAPVLLGTAANFAVLAKTGVSTVPASAISGNVGVSPATSSSLTGFSLIQDASKQFWTSTQVNGHLMGATDALPTPGLLTLAVLDMQTAYTDASNRPLPNFLELKAGLIGGSILVPGLYKWTTGVTITTGITLAGGPADTWIFQISGGLVQASAVTMTLIGGALPQNIIWAVAGTVSVGANAQFAGNILAQTNVVIGTNAIDNGCIYAQTDVALEKATFLFGEYTVGRFFKFAIWRVFIGPCELFIGSCELDFHPDFLVKPNTAPEQNPLASYYHFHLPLLWVLMWCHNLPT
ncbi:hypothetical protein DFH08DRAFT_934682 [Mycena albidolilacea]|uniref:Ice-binding protein n=1 Tax=Mycena albidolilacea TaxID=1033008 RepID=A0AAD7EWQ0_9AGAR|nr:hypothetical protein DFH08DRAFT_934682 [Mycena albidolilacea]